MKPVIVREVNEPRTAWICPHCDQEILEKHIYQNSAGREVHSDCQGEIRTPDPSEEQRRSWAAGLRRMGFTELAEKIEAHCGHCEGDEETISSADDFHRLLKKDLGQDEEPEEDESEEEEAEVEESGEDGDIEEVSDDPEGIEGIFNIGDHLSRIMKMLQSGSFGSPFLAKMVKRMLEPHLMGHMPLGDVTLDDEDVDNLGKFRGKIVIMTGSPEKMEKRIIKIASKDEDEFGTVVEKVLSKISDMYEAAHDMRAENIRVASREPIEYQRNLRKAYAIAQTCRDQGPISEDVSKILDLIDPTRYADSLGSGTLRLASDVISDISWYTDAPEFWGSIAERIKVAYRGMSDKGMVRSAYFMTMPSAVVGEQKTGTNICPRFKTQKQRDLEVPVEWSYCREQCIEGKSEDDGSVTCKYAAWLDRVADSHDKVMETLDVYRNPANDDMKMRIPDGKRSNPERPVMKSLERRLAEADLRTGKPWSEDGKDKSGRNLRNVTVEDLIGEILTDGSSGQRTGEGHQDTMETKLRDASGEAGKSDISERRLDERRNQYKSSSAEGEQRITEARLDGIRDLFDMPTDKLFDELLEKVNPRTDSEKPSEE